MNKLTLDDLADSELRSKRVLVRVDYNVPLSETKNVPLSETKNVPREERRQVTDDTRLRATLPTLERLVAAGARVVLLSHIGRPKGKPVPELSLRPAAERLAELIATDVTFVGETIGGTAAAAVDRLHDGAILVLENTRFLPGEEKNDPELSRALAELGDLFVNDAFGAAHRAHASTAGVAAVMRKDGRLAVAGKLMQRELEYLGRALQSPRRPFVAVLGGAKISGKIDVIEALLPRTDRLLIGGAMANTFFRAMGLETGTSLVEAERLSMAAELLERAGDRLVLPVDVVVAPKLEPGQVTRVVPREEISPGWMALDVGPDTADRFGREVGSAATVLWNGPLGVFEIPEFAQGTASLAYALAEVTARGATTVLGGGDSAAAINALGLADRVSHVSTGGGASLEFLEGRPLPGVELLTDREEV